MKLTSFFIIFIIQIYISHQVDIRICTAIGSLHDQDGNLIKRVCEVHRYGNYHNSDTYCRENGMHLLVLNDKDTFDALVNYMNNNWLSKSASIWSNRDGMWINGKRNCMGDWFTYAERKYSLSREIPWLYDSHYGSKSEVCLTIKRKGEFCVSGFDCNKGYYSMCEYDVRR